MLDINPGQFTETLNNKADRDLVNVDTISGADAVIEYQLPTEANNYRWYRKYKSGWIEQGGYFDYGSFVSSWSTTITLTKKMRTSTFHILISPHYMNNDKLGEFGMQTGDRTQTSFNTYFYTGAGTQDAVRAFFWEVKGIAD